MGKGVYKNVRILITSSILAIVLLIAGYFINNLPIFTGENLDQFYITQKLCEKFGISHNFGNDDVFFVNISYDKELVDANESNFANTLGEIYLGKTAITDRSKLYKFLKILKEKGEYKYIILDIMFDPNDKSTTDDLLYPLIAEMDNIVIIRDDSIYAPRDDLINKSALADYFATITATNFVRYQYTNKDGESYIPLKIYNDLHPNVEFRRYGLQWLPIYTSDGRLCHNSCFVAFDSKMFSSFNIKTETYSIKNYYNLGADILEDPLIKNEDDIGKHIHSLSKNKYVFIGNYTEDLHDTYMGLRPGSLILYRALKTLEEEKYIVSFWRGLYWFIIFTFIFWCILANKTVKCLIPDSLGNKTFIRKIFGYKLFMFILSLIGYSVILFLCSTLEYIVTCNIYSIILPMYAFMFIKLYCEYKRF